MEEIKTVEIHDKVFEETYTAHVEKNGTSWLGWIPEVPKVKCEEPTEAVLLKTLEKRLHEALVAEEEAWEKQFEEDVKAGRLDHLAEKASKNYREGKYRSIEELQKYATYSRRRFLGVEIPPNVQRRFPQKFRILS